MVVANHRRKRRRRGRDDAGDIGPEAGDAASGEYVGDPENDDVPGEKVGLPLDTDALGERPGAFCHAVEGSGAECS